MGGVSPSFEAASSSFTLVSVWDPSARVSRGFPCVPCVRESEPVLNRALLPGIGGSSILASLFGVVSTSSFPVPVFLVFTFSRVVLGLLPPPPLPRVCPLPPEGTRPVVSAGRISGLKWVRLTTPLGALAMPLVISLCFLLGVAPEFDVSDLYVLVSSSSSISITSCPRVGVLTIGNDIVCCILACWSIVSCLMARPVSPVRSTSWISHGAGVPASAGDVLLAFDGVDGLLLPVVLLKLSDLLLCDRPLLDVVFLFLLPGGLPLLLGVVASSSGSLPALLLPSASRPLCFLSSITFDRGAVLRPRWVALSVPPSLMVVCFCRSNSLGFLGICLFRYLH